MSTQPCPDKGAEAEHDMLDEYKAWLEKRGPLGVGASPERIFFAGYSAGRRTQPAADPATAGTVQQPVAESQVSVALIMQLAEQARRLPDLTAFGPIALTPIQIAFVAGKLADLRLSRDRGPQGSQFAKFDLTDYSKPLTYANGTGAAPAPSSVTQASAAPATGITAQPVDRYAGQLTEAEAAFVELVKSRPGQKLSWDEATSDNKPLWRAPEAVGLIKCIGSYKWMPLDQGSAKESAERSGS